MEACQITLSDATLSTVNAGRADEAIDFHERKKGGNEKGARLNRLSQAP
jgi:hypothetical protein